MEIALEHATITIIVVVDVGISEAIFKVVVIVVVVVLVLAEDAVVIFHSPTTAHLVCFFVPLHVFICALLDPFHPRHAHLLRTLLLSVDVLVAYTQQDSNVSSIRVRTINVCMYCMYVCMT